MKLISNLYTQILSLAFLAGMLLMTSCQTDDEDVVLVPAPTQNLATIVKDQSNISIFVQAVEAAGLSNLLSGTTALTFFAPDNGAFQAFLDANGFRTVNEVPTDVLTQVLSYHVVSGSLLSTDLTTGQVETQLAGSSIGIVVGESVILNGESTVTNANIAGTNGVIHVIDLVLDEIPVFTLGTLVDSLANASTGAEFTLLNRALERTGLDATLNASTGATVFAPTDAAFLAAGLDEAAIDATDLTELTNILLYHVLDGFNYSVQFTDGRVFTLLGGAGTAQGIDVSTGPITLNASSVSDGVSVTDANVLSTNGVVHVVNGVLSPTEFVWERMLSSSFRYGEFRTPFLDGSNQDLVDSLSGEEAYAILAPTPAFLVPVTTLSPAEIRTQMERHIFRLADNGNFSTLSSIASGSKITSLDGSQYFVTQNGDGTYFNGTLTVLEFNGSDDTGHRDIQVYNGQVTALGPNLNGSTGAYISGNFGFLEPLPEGTLSDSLNADASISLFAASVAKLELISDMTTYTIFAPDDAAFASVFSDLSIDNIDSLNALDPMDADDALVLADLQEAVEDYIFTGLEFAVDIVQDLPTLTTDGGASLQFIVDVPSGFLQILNIGTTGSTAGIQDNLDLISVDKISSNGVIHVIDGLLFE